ncbi:MAG TPA: alpha-isopropylmalate synthase regulatory domain-containing protein, partial [Nitrospirota bacterium]
LKDKLVDMGFSLSDDELNKVFDRFKKLADQKKEIFDEDIEALVAEEIHRIGDVYELKSLFAQSGTDSKPKADVVLLVEGVEVSTSANGDGPVDAALHAIAGITKTRSTVLAYEVKAITGGTDAQGEVVVRVREDGKTVMGSGSDTDIVIASAKAYVNALNKLVSIAKRGEKTVEKMCE